LTGHRPQRLIAALPSSTFSPHETDMANCGYCGTKILFGGSRMGDQRYCNATCAQRGALLNLSRQLPDTTINQQLWSVHQGRCPKCTGAGPVDVHTSYRVYSFLVMTRWVNTPQVSCRACGVKSQMTGAGLSLLLGWWGFPWGLIMTPVQIGRNIAAACSPPDPTKPSSQLERLVRVNIAAQVARKAPAAT
jgi:hypothetical protein